MDHTLTSYRDFFSLSCKVLFSKDILPVFDVSVFGVLRRNDARMACTFALVDKANSNFRRIKLHYKKCSCKKVLRVQVCHNILLYDWHKRRCDRDRTILRGSLKVLAVYHHQFDLPRMRMQIRHLVQIFLRARKKWFLSNHSQFTLLTFDRILILIDTVNNCSIVNRKNTIHVSYLDFN